MKKKVLFLVVVVLFGFALVHAQDKIYRLSVSVTEDGASDPVLLVVDDGSIELGFDGVKVTSKGNVLSYEFKNLKKLEFIDSDVTSIDDIKYELKIRLTDGGNTVVVESDDQLRSIDLYTISGVCVKSVSPKGLPEYLNVGGLSSGVYIIKAVTVSGNVKTFKFVK